MAKYNLIGKKFNKLLVIEKCKERNGKKVMWKCVCDCGNIVSVQTYHLTNNKIKSCGCFSRKYINNEISKSIYTIWSCMKNRCYSPQHQNYKIYNGKGITICDEWKNDFMSFYYWAINNGYQKGLSIDRIDNKGNYCPQNCRWTTKEQQMRNKTNNKMIKYKNQIKCLAEWCDILNLKYETIQSRFNRGWSIEKTFETPIRKFNNKSLSALAK